MVSKALYIKCEILLKKKVILAGLALPSGYEMDPECGLRWIKLAELRDCGH